MTEPARLAARPHHGRFPIPFVTYVRPDGRPDFRVHDDRRREECAEKKLCQLCGEWLGSEFAFVGDAESFHRRTFGEPPLHLECLEWAEEICPWLAGGSWRPDWADAAKEVEILPNPPGGDRYMAVYVTGSYEVIADDERDDGIKWVAGPPRRGPRWIDRVGS